MREAVQGRLRQASFSGADGAMAALGIGGPVVAYAEPANAYASAGRPAFPVKAVPLAVQALAPGGRLAVISFHSLEDRQVKEYFRLESRDCICPPQQPVCTCGHKASILEVSRRPITPTEAEIKLNPRARSAKLRIAEKL